MTWVVKIKRIPCIVCQSMGGWWTRVYNKDLRFPESVWVECQACDGKGHHMVEFRDWSKNDEQER